MPCVIFFYYSLKFVVYSAAKAHQVNALATVGRMGVIILMLAFCG